MSDRKDNLPATGLQLKVIERYMRKGYIGKTLISTGNLTRYEASLLILRADGIRRMRCHLGDDMHISPKEKL